MTMDKVVEGYLRQRLRMQEWLGEQFMKEMGLTPSEVEIVETMHATGPSWHFRKREASPAPVAVTVGKPLVTIDPNHKPNHYVTTVTWNPPPRCFCDILTSGCTCGVMEAERKAGGE